MASFNVSIKLRPIKFGFLVNLSNKNSLIKAIEANTFLWGGSYNPIIPYFKRLPLSFRETGYKSSVDLVNQYIETYDVDYIVKIGEIAESNNFSHRKIVTLEQLLSNLEGSGFPSYGVGIFELLQHFIYEELKFIRKKPIHFVLPKLETNYCVFLASIFGKLPQIAQNIFDNNFKNGMDIKEVECSLLNFSDVLNRGITLRKFTGNSHIDIQTGRPFEGNGLIFLLDGKNDLDIIDFWNLRAMGWKVLPVPKQILGSNSMKKSIENFIEQYYYPYRFNPQTYNSTSLLKSRSISLEEFEKCSKYFDNFNIGTSDNPSLTKNNNYPKISSEWLESADYPAPCSIETKRDWHTFDKYEEKIFHNIPILVPDFLQHTESFYFPKERFANEIKVTTYNDKELFAGVIPDEIKDVRFLLSTLGDEARVNKNQITYFVNNTRSIHFRLPKSDEVFEEFMKLAGWKIEISSEGRIVRQMLNQLEGIFGANVIANEGIINIINDANKQKGLKVEKLNEEIAKVIKNSNVSARLGSLTDKKILRLGASVKCTVCERYSWYSITDFNYELECLNCLSKFSIPEHSPKEIKWVYRTYGTFSLNKSTTGAIAVLLTYGYLNRVFSWQGAETVSLGFDAEKNGKKLEIDIAMFLQENSFEISPIRKIFIECKAFNSFEEKDMNRMKIIMSEFDNCIFIFATLKKIFQTKEKQLIKKFIKTNSKKDGLCRVMILTGNEIFPEPPLDLFHNVEKNKKIFTLCRMTQDKYLK